NLKDILEAEQSPLKEDFGVNFEGFKGKEAVLKLLEEQRGQVKGAFYKEGLGEIDLVWGEITDLEKHKGYGLAHILDKRKSEFVEQGASESEAAQKAAEFAKNEISNIMQNGKIINKANEATRIETQDYRLILKQNWKGEPTKNKWLVTAYMKKEKGESISSSPFTKEDNLSLNSNESIAQKALNLHEKLYLKDNDTPLNVEYKIVNKDDIKPSFTLSKTQFRSQKQEDLIKKIKENFNPDLLVNIRGDLKKGNPIITKEGEVISGNHRAAALKELEGENLAKYQNAVKEAFGVELKENEMLVRVADTSEAEIRRFSAASNEGLENNLGEQGVSLFAKYQDKIKALKEAKKPFVADDVYNLKYLVNKALGESSITKENDTSKALFASLARGRNNTILKALNELEKENLEQVSKVANMFFDNAGAFYNLTHDLDLPKMQNLQNYFSDVLVSAAKADFTRAEDFARLNEDIRAFLDSGDKNAMLKLSPNLVSDLLAKAMGAGFARFARLENPSASLYEFLNGLKKDLLEKGAPDLFSGGKGIKLNERDEFDFAKELILKGQDSEEKFRLYQNLEELKAWKSKSNLNQPTKESLDKDLNKSYTLELENLEPVSLNANALSKETEALTQSVENGHKQSTTIAKTDEQSIAQNAKNDEVLEAEVIEEVGLNEPMKFLEFQQRKLLTYIKENTPLRLLEHKKELKTRDILNFLEQSALNGKQKVFLMRNLERDFTKLKEDFKELESQSFKRDLLDKTKPLRKAEKEELTSEVLEQVQKENLKLYLNDTSGNLTKFLNAKKPFKITMRGANIKHILNRHGENSTLAKNGQPFVNLEDIKKYDEIINNADRQILKENDKGEKTLLSGKQINGHYIVISSVRLKNGELKLKTMYKENGKLENDKAFKSVKLPSETPSVLRGQSLTTDLDGYPSHADESIAQNAKSESEKEVLERQIPLIEAEIQKYEAKIASLDERIKKTQTRIQPYLDEINALQKQYDELYFTETRGEEANAKKWLKLEEIKAKQEELRKPYNDALFKFVFPYQRLKGKVQTEIQKLKFGLQDRALRLEEIQNEALNTSKAQKAWLEAFNLKSLEEAYIPNFKAEVKEAINRVLGGEEIKLTKGSFEKLLKRDREEFLPYIKDTLEKADLIIKDKENALIFVKDIGKKSYFTSVAKNANNEWVISTNSLKTLNTLKNRVDDNGEVLYLSKEAPNILAEAFTKRAFSNELAKDIIPQKANLEAVNKQKDKEFLEAYEKADFKGKVELAKQDINEEIKFLEKQKEKFERITQQKDYNDIELEQARKILENAKEEVEGHYRIKYMQNGKEMRAYISKTDYFNEGKILSKDEILHKIIQKTIYKDKIENIKKTSDKLKKQIKIIDEYLKEYGDNEAGAISDDIIEKFKYYNFAKDTGKGEIIIGERRKGLYEQAQKVLNSRFLKAKKRATQSKKNYNITYDEARKLFYKGDMSEEQKELFQSVLPIAQKLNVRIRTAVREPYEDMIKDTTNIAGMYRYELNTATLKKGGNRTDTQRAETLLHELIHSVTSRAMSLYKTPLRDKMLSKTQIKAIDEIDQIYKKLYKFKKTFKLQDENGADLYGIKNSHEMLAELANPMFSSKLKEIGLYEKLVNNIMKIILSVRDFIRLRSDKNVYEKLKQCLKDIIENYKDDFTQEYEKQNIRDFTLTSQTQKEQIYTQRQELKSTLKAKINQAITNENTGEKAILTNKGISKMLSDKAISKSVDNGFSREEHLRAVGVVDELFKRAKRAFSKRDEKDKNLSIYRYNAPFKNANALMTLKEYKQNGKRIYSLELENLEAAKFNPSGKDLAEQLSKSKDADTTTFHTPIDNPDESIAQKSDNIYHSNPHLGAGLVGGVLNGVEQDENGNLSFDPVKFAMGFLGGAAGSKAVWIGFKHLEKNPELKEKIINELAHTLAQGFEKAREKYSLLNLLEPRYIVQNEKGRKIQAKSMLKELEREQKGLYNVAFNGKNASLIKQDLQSVESAIAFMQGTRYKGAKHERIKHLTDPSKEGYVTDLEFVNLGKSIREFLKNYEPFIDTNGARLYEWENKDKVRFRVVVNDVADMDSNPTTATEEIITFYSDRNLKEKMKFKNPLLKDTIAQASNARRSVEQGA
ncbi:PBECR2 nuclease fold domain-containing protein, partial [Campylobacter upsaliensis]